MNTKAALAIAGVFIGCCSNVVFLELLVKSDPGSGNLITFSQFLFIAVEGFFFTANCGSRKPIISLKDYLLLVVMFFTTSVFNNYAFDFNIPMPLHMIFRSGSLIANMIMGIVILKRRYKLSKYLSVGLITVGIIICTIVSGSNVSNLGKAHDSTSEEESASAAFVRWAIGITLLTAALLISACMGIYQEVLYKRFGKHSREALFYTHILPLPGFLLMYKNIWEHWLIGLHSEPIEVPAQLIAAATVVGTLQIPSAVIYIIGNMITQYVCISSVYVLTAECASLTVTLIITLRKFVSLLFSIYFFKNSFSIWHWIGTLLVFVGTIVFTEVIPQLKSSVKQQQQQSSLTKAKKIK